jgi:hypothetical protein
VVVEQGTVNINYWESLQHKSTGHEEIDETIRSMEEKRNPSKYEEEVSTGNGPPNKGFRESIKDQIDEPIRHSQKKTSEFERTF